MFGHLVDENGRVMVVELYCNSGKSYGGFMVVDEASNQWRSGGSRDDCKGVHSVKLLLLWGPLTENQ